MEGRWTWREEETQKPALGPLQPVLDRVGGSWKEGMVGVGLQDQGAPSFLYILLYPTQAPKRVPDPLPPKLFFLFPSPVFLC